MPLQGKTKSIQKERWSNKGEIWTVTYYETPCLEYGHFYYNDCIEEEDELIFFRDLSPGFREKLILTESRALIYRHNEPGDYDWYLIQNISLECV